MGNKEQNGNLNLAPERSQMRAYTTHVSNAIAMNSAQRIYTTEETTHRRHTAIAAVAH